VINDLNSVSKNDKIDKNLYLFKHKNKIMTDLKKLDEPIKPPQIFCVRIPCLNLNIFFLNIYIYIYIRLK